jgi:RsmE family RNA methyltransferase
LVEYILNLILLTKPVQRVKWDKSSKLFHHLQKTLRVRQGSKIDCAVENGPRGKGIIDAIDKDEINLSFQWDPPHPPDFLPVRLVVGLSRPQTCRKILEQAASMGVAEIHFFGAEKGEPSYASSTLWTTDEWENKIRAGVAQAFSSHIPFCKLHQNLESLIAEIPDKRSIRLGLDNYEAGDQLESFSVQSSESIWLAVGAERGWSAHERDLLRENEFTLKHLGKRILRVETAVVAALGILGSGIEA